MKYKSITYDITIGSYWPEQMYPSQIVTPQGGRDTSITLELPEHIDHPKPMDFADNLLADHVKTNYPGQDYHIWYWWWDTIPEEGE